MKIKITLLALLVCFAAKSQTITYSKFSKVLSDTTHLQLADNSSLKSSLLLDTGKNVSWDASGIKKQSGGPSLNLSYYPASKMKHYNLFPGSNYVPYDSALSSIFTAEFQSYTSDSVVKIGEYSVNTAHEIYHNPDKSLVFPFAYGDYFIDSYSKTNYKDSVNKSSYQTGTRTVKFDGYGKLILPSGTYTSVARVSEIRTNSLGPNSPTVTWYDINNGKVLLQYHENAGKTTIIFTGDAPVTGIGETQTAFSITVYPNPVKDKLNFIISDSYYDVNCVIYIKDMVGKEVISVPVKRNQVSVNADQLTKGVYIYQVKNNTGITQAGKFIKE